jgi:hypothetical protein
MSLMLFYIFCRSLYLKMQMVAKPRNSLSRTRAKLLLRVPRKVRHRATSMERQPEHLEGPDLEPEVTMGLERILRSLVSHPTRMTLVLMLDLRVTKKNLRTQKIKSTKKNFRLPILEVLVVTRFKLVKIQLRLMPIMGKLATSKVKIVGFHIKN